MSINSVEVARAAELIFNWMSSNAGERATRSYFFFICARSVRQILRMNENESLPRSGFIQNIYRAVALKGAHNNNNNVIEPPVGMQFAKSKSAVKLKIGCRKHCTSQNKMQRQSGYLIFLWRKSPEVGWDVFDGSSCLNGDTTEWRNRVDSEEICICEDILQSFKVEMVPGPQHNCVRPNSIRTERVESTDEEQSDSVTYETVAGTRNHPALPKPRKNDRHYVEIDTKQLKQFVDTVVNELTIEDGRSYRCKTCEKVVELQIIHDESCKTTWAFRCPDPKCNKKEISRLPRLVSSGSTADMYKRRRRIQQVGELVTQRQEELLSIPGTHSEQFGAVDGTLMASECQSSDIQRSGDVDGNNVDRLKESGNSDSGDDERDEETDDSDYVEDDSVEESGYSDYGDTDSDEESDNSYFGDDDADNEPGNHAENVSRDNASATATVPKKCRKIGGRRYAKKNTNPRLLETALEAYISALTVQQLRDFSRGRGIKVASKSKLTDLYAYIGDETYDMMQEEFALTRVSLVHKLRKLGLARWIDVTFYTDANGNPVKHPGKDGDTTGLTAHTGRVYLASLTIDGCGGKRAFNHFITGTNHVLAVLFAVPFDEQNRHTKVIDMCVDSIYCKKCATAMKKGTPLKHDNCARNSQYSPAVAETKAAGRFVRECLHPRRLLKSQVIGQEQDVAIFPEQLNLDGDSATFVEAAKEARNAMKYWYDVDADELKEKGVVSTHSFDLGHLLKNLNGFLRRLKKDKRGRLLSDASVHKLLQYVRMNVLDARELIRQRIKSLDGNKPLMQQLLGSDYVKNLATQVSVMNEFAVEHISGNHFHCIPATCTECKLALELAKEDSEVPCTGWEAFCNLALEVRKQFFTKAMEILRAQTFDATKGDTVSQAFGQNTNLTTTSEAPNSLESESQMGVQRLALSEREKKRIKSQIRRKFTVNVLIRTFISVDSQLAESLFASVAKYSHGKRLFLGQTNSWRNYLHLVALQKNYGPKVARQLLRQRLGLKHDTSIAESYYTGKEEQYAKDKKRKSEYNYKLSRKKRRINRVQMQQREVENHGSDVYGRLNLNEGTSSEQVTRRVTGTQIHRYAQRPTYKYKCSQPACRGNHSYNEAIEKCCWSSQNYKGETVTDSMQLFMQIDTL